MAFLRLPLAILFKNPATAPESCPAKDFLTGAILTGVKLARTLCLALVFLSSLSIVQAADVEKLSFEQHIRPIFRAHCFDCHGATEKFKGDLDLRLVRFIKKGGKNGPAIVPGNPQGSYLLERIQNGEMPPGENSVPQEEIEIIKRWIAAGAVTARPEPVSIGTGISITAEERNFWAFQLPQQVKVPARSSFPSESRVRTSIDALVLQGSPNLSNFSTDARRNVLVKRAYLGLLGLPPSPDEMLKWQQDDRVDWYDHLLSELLESPHYGERWARHWLDVAGYADSEGSSTADDVRNWSWKYRDWVIRALNDDKPFDRFIIEQLAGDELAGPQDGDLTTEQIELLTASGFLRMAADGTKSNKSADAKNQVITDTLKIISTSLLGLSIQCAQCHDHRYDPISQSDYYALRAIFEPSLDWQAWKTPPERLVSLYTAANRVKASEIEAEAKSIADEKSKKQAEYLLQALEKELMKYEEPLRTQLRDAFQTPGDQRNDEHKKLLDQYPSVKIQPGVLYQYLPDAAKDLEKFDKRMKDVRAKKPVEEFLRALVEPANHLPETKLFFRGDHRQPKQTVSPAALTITSPKGTPHEIPVNDPSLVSTGRRLAFAKWLTNGRHPLVARVIVNRIWMHHFGQGLVSTPSDFGKLGTLPMDQRLLDWLAIEFVQQGWSLKKLHRLIMTSTVWRQSSEVPTHPSSQSELPYSRKRLMRLEAEIIRDRMLAATGQLDRTLFGSPVKINKNDSGQVVVNEPQTRRSIYIQMRRSQPVAMLQSFDAPVMETNCELRANSTVATQSLMLLNGEFILNQSARLAERAAKEAGDLSDQQLDILPDSDVDWTKTEGREVIAAQLIRAWELALCRPPRDDELTLAMNFVMGQIKTYQELSDPLPAERTPSRQAMVNVCQTLLSSNEFLYVD